MYLDISGDVSPDFLFRFVVPNPSCTEIILLSEQVGPLSLRTISRIPRLSCDAGYSVFETDHLLFHICEHPRAGCLLAAATDDPVSAFGVRQDR